MKKSKVRMKRSNGECKSLRGVQDRTFEEKIQELMDALKRNNDMLDAIIKHLDVPYKPPAGFVKD
ncbi:MAG: hypothetical protein OXG85_05275 [Chloroflexi bacterium]|nr:hypothetical protein [Chloroflexota bacterium]